MAKKKKKEVVVQRGVLEHEGVKVGDEVWCRRFPTNEIAMGVIKTISLEDSEPCFTFSDRFDGSFRLALFSSIIPMPTKAMWAKLDSAHVRQNRSADRAQEKLAKKLAAKAGVVRRK